MSSEDLPEPLTRRRRRPRLRAEQVRAATLEAARELVYDMGIVVSLEDLGMEDVIRRAGVPRSSVYRIWPYKGDFVDELLEFLAGPEWLGAAQLNERSVAVALEVVRAAGPDLGDPARRMPVAREALRQSVAHYVAGMQELREWRMFMALKATVRFVRDPVARSRLAGQLQRSESQFLTSMGGYYQALALVVGLRLRDPALSWHHLAMLGAGLGESFVLRQDVVGLAAGRQDDDPASEDVGALARALEPLRLPGPDGVAREHTLAAFGYIALLEAMAEPDPEVAWPPVLPAG